MGRRFIRGARARLPEILLEMASVVLAVLLALWVNDWHRQQENRKAADLARQGVLGEIRANQLELLRHAGQNRQVLSDLTAHVRATMGSGGPAPDSQASDGTGPDGAGPDAATAARPESPVAVDAPRIAAPQPRGSPRDVSEIVLREDAWSETESPGLGGDGSRVEYSISLLTSAAWTTTQLTLATHHMRFEWVTQVARLYELQAFFTEAQDSLVAYMSGLAVANTDEQELRSLLHRLATVVQLQDALIEQYLTVHPRLEAPAGQPPGGSTDGAAGGPDPGPGAGRGG